MPTLKMASATLLSRVLGLVREQAMAFYFGVSGTTDAFLVALRIPNLMRDLFAEGAFSSAFVPVFTERMQGKEGGTRSLLWTVFICLLGVTTALSLVMALAAPSIVGIFAPSFARNPEKLQLTVLMVRIMSPFLALVSLAALFAGALNSLKVFFIPALTPAVLNIAMILSMVGAGFAIHRGGWQGELDPIVVVAVGVCVGGLLQCLVQWPWLLAKKLGPTLQLNFSDPGVGKIFKKLGPGLLGFAATQINLIVSTILATSTVVGAVSWLNFAFRLFQFPVGVMGVSVANSNLVLFSDAWKRGDRELALATLRQAVHFGLFLLFPATALLWALSLLMVQVIFQRGEFVYQDSLNTATALRIYVLGLPCYGLYKIFVPVFYTMDREKIPVWASAVSIAFNVAFCVVLVPRHGFQVLAMGTGLSILLNVLIQGVVLQRYLGFPRTFLLNGRVAKFFLASVLCALVVASAMGQSPLPTDGTRERVLALVLYVALGGTTYLTALLATGEGAEVKRVLKKFF